MPQPTVLLTAPIHPDAHALVAEHADVIVAPDMEDETLHRLAGDAEGIIVRLHLPDDILAHAPKLRGVVRHGTGYDTVPVEALTKAGVAIANVPGTNAQGVAEYAIAALLALRRPLKDIEQTFRTRPDGWTAGRALANKSVEIAGTTIGLIGFGSVGSRIAKIAGAGFGMTVLATARRKGRMPPGVEEVALDELFARADAVVVCCELTRETRGLVDARLIGLMKPGAVLVNVARGPVVVTAALVEALEKGRIAGAAIDVYDENPVRPDNPLFKVPNLVMTPHVGGTTREAIRATSMGAAEEMVRIVKGERPKNLVNPDCYNHR